MSADTLSETIDIVRDIDGKLYLREGQTPPTVVAFGPEMVDVMRRGESPWATVEGGALTSEIVVMRLCPVTLRYRLTSEVDLTGGLVAVRVDENGALWIGGEH